MNSPTLPLPLELSKPVLLAGDLDTQMREGLSDKYDTKTQLCSATNSCLRSNSMNGAGVQVDVTVDIQVDDIIA